MTDEPDEMDEFLELVGEEYEEPVNTSWSIITGSVKISPASIRVYYDTSDSGG